MYIIQSSPVSPFKQQPAFLRLAAISPLCLYLQESGGYMAAESPLEAKIQISSFGKNPIWVREGGPTLRGHHTCPSSRMTTLSGGIDSPWRALQNTKVSAENDFSPQVGFFIEVRHKCSLHGSLLVIGRYAPCCRNKPPVRGTSPPQFPQPPPWFKCNMVLVWT